MSLHPIRFDVTFPVDLLNLKDPVLKTKMWLIGDIVEWMRDDKGTRMGSFWGGITNGVIIIISMLATILTAGLILIPFAAEWTRQGDNLIRQQQSDTDKADQAGKIPVYNEEIRRLFLLQLRDGAVPAADPLRSPRPNNDALILDLRNQITTLTAQLHDAQEAKNFIIVGGKQTRLSELTAILEAKDKEIDELKAREATLLAPHLKKTRESAQKIEELEADKALLRKEIEDLRELGGKATPDVAALNGKIKSLTAQLEGKTRELQAKTQEVSNLAPEARRAESLTKQLADVQKQLEAKPVGESDAEIVRLTAALKTEKATTLAMDKEIRKLNAELEEAHEGDEVEEGDVEGSEEDEGNDEVASKAPEPAPKAAVVPTAPAITPSAKANPTPRNVADIVKEFGLHNSSSSSSNSSSIATAVTSSSSASVIGALQDKLALDLINKANGGKPIVIVPPTSKKDEKKRT